MRPGRRGQNRMVLRKPPERDDEAPIRIVAGPQADHFDDAALGRLPDRTTRITAEADRMLACASTARRWPTATPARARSSPMRPCRAPSRCRQRPADLVLLADGRTAGSYPKIATVVSADLPRLALRRRATARALQTGHAVSEAGITRPCVTTSHPGPSRRHRARSATTVSTSRRSAGNRSAAWSMPVRPTHA